MTREEIKKMFPEATEEQITALLNRHNQELVSEREKAAKAKDDADKLKEEADKLKGDAARVSALEKRLNELKEQAAKANEIKSEAAESQKKLVESNTKIEELERQIAEVQGQLKKAETMKALADKGITGEYAENFFNEDGTVNFDTLGKVISDREVAAAAKKEQDIAENSSNPNGGAGKGDGGDAKPYDVEVAERLKFGQVPEDAKNARDYYR